MKKTLSVFLGLVIMTGTLQTIIAHQSTKLSSLTQCSEGGCNCDGNRDRGDDQKN